MMGVPATQRGWMSRHGHRLTERNAEGYLICPESGWRYHEESPTSLVCLDEANEETLA